MSVPLTDTKTPRLDAFVQRWRHADSMSLITALLLNIHGALDGLRGDRRGSGPYGALEHIASSVEDFLEDSEDTP